MMLIWDDYSENLNRDAYIDQFQSEHKLDLPNSYIDLHKKFVRPELKGNYLFSFYNMWLGEESAYSLPYFYRIYGLESSMGVADLFRNPPEGLPKGLIIFAPASGGGDELCFDMRKPYATESTPIVVWHCHGDPNEEISMVAPSFDAFLRLLHPATD